MSMVKALGFEAASWSLTEVSGVKHTVAGRAQGWEVGAALQSWPLWSLMGDLGQVPSLSGPHVLICKRKRMAVLAWSHKPPAFSILPVIPPGRGKGRRLC